MRRWWIAFFAVVIACVPVLMARATSAGLLEDSDTRVALVAIRSRQDPLSWFRGDWPLENHFYRPVSTLAFEFDNAVYGSRAAGYGLTNALLCIACILLLFWTVRELFDSPSIAAGSAVLFAIWHLNYGSWLATLAGLLAWPTLIVGLWRHRGKIYIPISAVLLSWFLADELIGLRSLNGRMLQWIPGRTASVMTVFALIALAAYARYERVSAVRSVPVPAPTDPPATRNSEAPSETPARLPWLWAALSLAATLAALGAYEQAVMLPAALLGVAVSLRWRGYRVRWGWQAAFWACLVGYLLLRRALVPSHTSGYQDQQLRSSLGGVFLTLTEYILPAAGGFVPFLGAVAEGPIIWLTGIPYRYLLATACQLAAIFEARRQLVLIVTGYLLSILAFLPMAWVKEFDHYHYWPMAMRSMFVFGFGLVAAKLLAIAWSPPARQAPGRPNPAPGSLLRP